MPNCIFGCVYKPGLILHRFPNPRLDQGRLKKWRNIIGELTKGLDDQTLYLRSRICHRHFEAKYWNRYNRINRLAIPTLFLPDSRKIFKKPAETAKPIEKVSLSNENSCIPHEEAEDCSENIVGSNKIFEENLHTDEPSDKLFSPHVNSLLKNSVAVKYACVQMSTADLHICGECHSVFYFIQQFKEHREGVTCSGISPFRSIKENIANTWAFFLWKSSTLVAHVGDAENSQLMKKWKELPEKTKEMWIIAGKQIYELSKYANIQLESDAQTTKQLNNNVDPLLQDLKSDHEDTYSLGSVESEQDPLSIEPNSGMPKWDNVSDEHSVTALETRSNVHQRQEAQPGIKPCMVVLEDISRLLPLVRCSTIHQDDLKAFQSTNILASRVSPASQNTTLKPQRSSLKARSVTLQPSAGVLTQTCLAAIRSTQRSTHPHPKILKSSKTHKNQANVQSSIVAKLDNKRLNPRIASHQVAENSGSVQLPASQLQNLSPSEAHSEGFLSKSETESHSEIRKSQDLALKTAKENQLKKGALRVPRNRPWRANFKIREKKPVRLWKLPSGVLMKGANPLIKKMKLMVNHMTQMDEAKYKKVYYVMEKDKSDESEQLQKATSFVHKYNEIWKKNKLPVPPSSEEKTMPENAQVKPVSSQHNQKKQSDVMTKEAQISLDATNIKSNITPSEEPSSYREPSPPGEPSSFREPLSFEEPSKQTEHTYSKCPPSVGPIVRKPVVRTRVFPTPPLVNNGIIITSWGVNNRYLEQTTVETPISSPSLTTDAMKQRNKKSVSKELEDQFFRNLGPLPPPSPEPDLTLCPLTGELLAPAEGADGPLEEEEIVDGSALSEEHDNMSLPSMPMLLEEALSFNE